MANSYGQIYKLSNPSNDLCYIGSTTKCLKYRLSKHKSDYKRWKRSASSYYTCFSLFDTYGMDNIEIDLVEDYVNKDDLLTREKYFIRKFNSCNKLNGNKSYLNSMD